MNKRITFFALLTVFTIIAVACAPAPAPTPVPPTAPSRAASPVTATVAPTAPPAATHSLTPLKKVTVRYSTVAGTQSLEWPIHVAIKQGYFAREGIELEITVGTSIADAVKVLAAGSADVGLSGPDFLIKAVDAGSPLVGIAGMNNLNTYSVIVRPEIKGPEDLKGKVISVGAPNVIDSWIINRYLGRYGLKPDRDYSLVVAGGPPARYAAVKAGQAAAVVLPQPQDLQALDDGMKRLASAPDIVKVAHALLIARKAWLDENPAAARGFLRALRDGARWLHDPANKPAASQLLAELTKVKPEVALATYDVMVVQLSAMSKEGEVDRPAFEAYIQLLLEFGVLSPPAPAGDKYLDTRLIDELRKQR